METSIPTFRYSNYVKLFAPFLTGLLAAQIIATVFVYISNRHIFALVQAIEKAGYTPLPTGRVIPMLEHFEPAFWGGLFFTLSIGVGLTIVSWSVIQVWHLVFLRNRHFLVLCLLLYIGLVTILNLDGMSLFPMLFYLLIPLATAWVTYKKLPEKPNNLNFRWLVPVITLVTLTALWSTQLNQNLFTTIRDQVLLSNPIGQFVNDFYYRYTLFAAETFKSFRQKTLRSCHIEGLNDPLLLHQWQQRLAQQDILVLPDYKQPDVIMLFSPHQLQFIHSNGAHFYTTPREFIANPEKTLKAFSTATDNFVHFRKITLFGLLIGFPVFLYILTYGVLRIAVRWILKPEKTTLAVSSLCMVIGVLLFLPMLHAKPFEIVPEKIETALTSDQWFHRVAALRYIETHGLEIAKHPSYQRLLISPYVVERYWLARSLAKSRTKSTYDQLLTLLDDSHPNVICQVFYALGERGRKAAIAPIKHKMNMTDHWYAQWYGYNALRKLGWRQTPSN